jgi:Secretion system C-terminal sorting domain
MLNKFFTLSLSTYTVLLISSMSFGQQVNFEDHFRLYTAGEQSEGDQSNERLDSPTDLVVINYDGPHFTALAVGFTYIAGARFRTEITGPFTGGELQFVQFFYFQTAAALTIKIYDAGTATEPGRLLVDQPIDLGTLTVNDWNQVELSNYITITGNDLWVCLEVDDANNFFYGLDIGSAYDPDGDWVNTLQGGGWQHLQDFGLGSRNFNIRGVVDDTPVSVDEDEINPIGFELMQNYPNPFNPTTTVKYSIPELSFITIKVFDVLGNEIATLVNEEKLAGSYEVEFKATTLPSGIYFYKLQAGSYVETKKMALLR